ncbi:hypothetical protein R1sor_023441 [Riccia sorocarpa]|uniref:FCP1 homology domain-containing protein n=1 Tax=Riccia sorocarpa TaxID=122646 RepID=A0ABD3GR05_9MARC
MSTIEDPMPRLVHRESARGKILILDLNGLLVRYYNEEKANAARPNPYLFFRPEPEIEVWSQPECIRYETSRESDSGGYLYLKRFPRLYHYNLASRDVLLVDNSVKKNSTNSPFSAIHPRSFIPWTEEHAPHRDQFLCGTLLLWLQAWRQCTTLTPDYVCDHYHEIGAQDPIERLRSYWGPELTPELSTRLFCDVTAADMKIAMTFFTSTAWSTSRVVIDANLVGEIEGDMPVEDMPVGDVPISVTGVDDTSMA